MYQAIVSLTIDRIPPEELARVFEGLAETLVTANVVLRRLGMVPPLFDSGVIYGYKHQLQEPWRDAGQILATPRNASGEITAACAELAAWKAADYRMQGIPAAVTVRYYRQPDGWLYHVTVETPAGEDDPSLALGMEPIA